MKFSYLLIALILIASCNNLPEQKPQSLAAKLPSTVIVIKDNGDSLFITGKDTTICAVVTKYDTVTKPYKPTVDTGIVTRKNLIFESLFENPNPFSPYYSPTQSCCTYSITASKEQFRFGTQSARFELHASDPPFAGAVRAELYPNIKDPMYVERWLGLSYYFPSATMVKMSDYDLLAQWHPTTSNGSPFFSFRIANGQWFAPIGNGNNINGNPDNETFTYYYFGNYKLDAWNDIVIHYKQASDKTGVIEVWINGVKQKFNGADKYTGITSYPNIGSYLKVGDNHSQWKGNDKTSKAQRIFFIDNVRYGNEKASFADVDPSKP